MTRLLALCFSLLLTASAFGANLQYHLITGEVTNLSDAAIPAVPGYGVAIVEGLAAAYVWPTPAGCVSGEGRLEWSRVTSLAPLTIEVKPSVLIFTTTSPLLPGCYQVQDVAALNQLLDDAVDAVLQAFPRVHQANTIFASVSARCPAADVTADCVTARANRTTIGNAAQPSAAALATFTSNVIMMHTDANQFKSDQCTANPAGPFC